MRFVPEASRLLKVMVDAGDCSIPEAEARIASARMTVYLDPGHASEPAAQAAVMTAVATGVRCFIGGVWLCGATATPAGLPGSAGTIGALAEGLGAKLLGGGEPIRGSCIAVGSAPDVEAAGSIRAWWSGWQAGTLPGTDRTPPGGGGNRLAGSAAGALAVAAAFRALNGDVEAGRVSRTISLWSPGDTGAGPEDYYLPDGLWLVGLGNLGQAYLWALSMLPYRNPADLLLVMQDEDDVRDVNWGTSLLVPRGRYGMLKTRVAEDFALRHGFRVRRVDRFLDGATSRWTGAPQVALSGLDRIDARRPLGGVGFERIVDCGLGATARDYGKFRLNVFDPEYTATRHFEGVGEMSDLERNLRLKAYRDGMEGEGKDPCGMAELAGASAAAPFVGAFVATLAVAQAIRMASAVGCTRSLVGNVGRPDEIRVSWMGCRPARLGYAGTRGRDLTGTGSPAMPV